MGLAHRLLAYVTIRGMINTCYSVQIPFLQLLEQEKRNDFLLRPGIVVYAHGGGRHKAGFAMEV